MCHGCLDERENDMNASMTVPGLGVQREAEPEEEARRVKMLYGCLWVQVESQLIAPLR